MGSELLIELPLILFALALMRQNIHVDSASVIDLICVLKKHLESFISTTFYNNLPLEIKSLAIFTILKSSLYHYIMS